VVVVVCWEVGEGFMWCVASSHHSTRLKKTHTTEKNVLIFLDRLKLTKAFDTICPPNITMKLSAALVLLPLFVATLSQQIVPTTSLPTSLSMISTGITKGLNFAKGLYYPAPIYIVHNHHHHTPTSSMTPIPNRIGGKGAGKF
jgi:hypothetical protein